MSLDKESPLYSMMMRERVMDAKQDAPAATDAPTPESDAVILTIPAPIFYPNDTIDVVRIDFARRLERERDVNYKMSILNKVEAEKQYERAEKAEAERDAAREELQGFKEGAEDDEAHILAQDKQISALQKRLDDAGEGLPPEPCHYELAIDRMLQCETDRGFVRHIDYDSLRAAAESIIARKDADIERLKLDRSKQLADLSKSCGIELRPHASVNCLLKELATRLEVRNAEIARLREDAARYRWIRQGEPGQPRTRLMQYHHDIHLDEAIDEAMK